MPNECLPELFGFDSKLIRVCFFRLKKTKSVITTYHMMVRENVFSITDSYLFRFILLGLQERLGKIFDMTLCRSCLFSVCCFWSVCEMRN